MAGGGGPAQLGPFARAIRGAYLVVAWAFVAAILVQVFFAGLGIFTQTSYWVVHRDFGYWIGILPFAMLILAPLGRLPRRAIIFGAVLFVLYFLQTTLPVIRDPPFIAAFHTVVALLLFGLAAMTAVRAHAFVPRPLGAAPAKAAAPP